MERTELEQWRAKEVARLLALVETERRYYQEMVAMLPLALVVLAADRRILSANRVFRQTLGLRLSELRGKTIDQILPSERLVEKIRDVHTSGVSQTAFPLEHDGRQFRVAISPLHHWDDESEIETLLMLEEAGGVRGADPAVESLSEIPAIVWEADTQKLEFRSVRGDVEGMLGYSRAHWTDTPNFFEKRIHPDDRAPTMSFFRAAIEEKRDASAEFRCVTASGSAVWVRETIRFHAGALAGVTTSIEQRKQLEAQLVRSGRADALQGLASKLSHDLNNPLMIVTGYAEEMRNSLGESDPMRADADEILSATSRISGIVAQLLNYARRAANPAVPVNVTEVLTGMEEKIAGAAGEGCTVHLAGDPAWAMADAAQLQEIVLALVSGDREDARERSRLTVGYGIDEITERIPGRTLAPGKYTVVVIHDDGRGLDEAKRAAVFEGFLSKPGEKTAGPPLARAYAIVREWGGDIAFLSEAFRGSTFLIYLPHHDGTTASSSVAEPVSEPVVKPAPEPAAKIVRETILLVEDEAGIRALVRKILRRENYNVIEASTAEEAIALASSVPGRIDLLVTDVMLPNASGRELAERLFKSRQDLKVLYISGYTDDDAVRSGTIPPGSRFLQKPFTLGALVNKVKESLTASAL